jgi:uncharacterized protein (DUF1778 family)
MSHPNRAEAPSVAISIRLSPDERDRVNQAAQANRQTPSDFARDALITAADDCLEKPIRST